MLLSATSSASNEAELVRLAAEKELGKDLAWRKILIYVPQFLSSEQSLIDSHELFFFSPNGKQDPQAELEATIAAYYRPVSQYANQNDHPICRFPARRKYLSRFMKFEGLPEPDCDQFRVWKENRNYEAVSLIFSSYYTNNPASMFGHTFLRLHKPRTSLNAELLDDSINFAAFPDESSGFFYYFKGAVGGFPGRYSLIPYYSKVQEYNNAEQRDLWEYELDFDADDIEMLLLMTWELGPTHVDYWYFDDNCSAVLLTLLSAAKPEANFYRDMIHEWVMPTDTVRVVHAIPGMVRKVTYIPSSMSRFLFRYRALNIDEQEFVESVVSRNRVDEFKARLDGVERSRQVDVLDAVVEFIDFREKLAGANPVTTHKDLRRAVLAKRAGLRTKSSPITYRPDNERPEMGHGSAKLSLGGGTSLQQGSFAQLGWRPALHDMLASPKGFPTELEIHFWNLQLRFLEEGNQAYVEKWELFKVWNLPRVESIIRGNSWGVNVGVYSIFRCGEQRNEPCYRTEVAGAYGYSLPLFSRKAVLYGLLRAAVGHSEEDSQRWFMEPGVEFGAIASFPWDGALGIKRRDARGYGVAGVRDHMLTEVELSQAFLQNWELRASVRKMLGRDEIWAYLSYYY